MALKSTVSAARLLYDCLLKGKPNFSQIPYTPSKTRQLDKDPATFLKKTFPGRANISEASLLRFVNTLTRDGEIDCHSLVVLARGKCIFEAAKEGYDTRLPHATFSLCKTLVSMAVGFLVDEGKLHLSNTAISFFPELSTLSKNAKTRGITVHHLLAMTSGAVFNETGAVLEETFSKAFFEFGVHFAPGVSFSYNSMNSYILAAIVKKVSGMSLSAFLEKRLFAPLGITNYFWEMTKEEVEKGGWGLYLSTRSMAKIGLLILNNGRYGKKQILSQHWISLMTKVQSKVPKEISDLHYGYHLWCEKSGKHFLLNGLFGQNVWIYPEKSLVIAITSGENTVFHDAGSLRSAISVFSEPSENRGDRAARHALRRLKKHFGEVGSFTPKKKSPEADVAREMLREELFQTFSLPQNNAGLLPLITRIMQNSPTKGITSLSFAEEKKNRMLLHICEEDVTYTLHLGENDFWENHLSVRDEKYRIYGAYSFERDIDRHPYCRIELRFSALPNTRRMLIYPTKDGLTLKMSEQPSFTFVEKLIRVTPYNMGEEAPFLGRFVNSKLTEDFLFQRAKAVFSPTFRLKKEDRKTAARQPSQKKKKTARAKKS